MTREQKAVDWRELAKALKPRTRGLHRRQVRAGRLRRHLRLREPGERGSDREGRLLRTRRTWTLAVASARKAFEGGAWSRRAPAARKKVLLRFAELIRKHREELALTETMDMGKPISDSMKIDIPAAANCIAWYAEAIDKVYDEVAPTAHDTLALITRESVGVVGGDRAVELSAADGLLEARARRSRPATRSC